MRKLQIKLNKSSSLLWAFFLSIFIILFMAFFPSMANESMQSIVDSKLDGLPPALLSIVGFDKIPDFTQITVYYGYIMQYINVALAIYALNLGLASFLQEETDGTIEYLFAHPISRTQLIIEKLKANLMLTIGVVSFIILTSVFGFMVFKDADIILKDLLVESLPIFGSYYGIAIIFLILGSGLSLLFKSVYKIMNISMAIIFGTYFIGIMSTIVKVLEPFKFLSLLHVLLPSKLYLKEFDFLAILFWLILAIATFMFALKKFQKRDIYI